MKDLAFSCDTVASIFFIIDLNLNSGANHETVQSTPMIKSLEVGVIHVQRV